MRYAIVRYAIVITTLAAGALLAACASTPKTVQQLESARAEVQTLAQDPKAAEAASRELEAARSQLQQAEDALKERRPMQEVVHLSYLAERQAQIGQTRIAEARAREQVAQGEAERNRVLLEARTREAESATRQARAAQAAAEAKSQEAESARQDALAARAETESLQQQFAELQAKQTERGMVLTLSDVLFDTAAATLEPGANLAIDRLTEFLEENPDTRIIIEGHTDSRGSEEYNEDLSRRRAQAVSAALIAKGVAASRFEVLGRGEAYPVANNESAAGRQQNRRVEIVFSDTSGRFAQGSETPPALR